MKKCLPVLRKTNLVFQRYCSSLNATVFPVKSSYSKLIKNKKVKGTQYSSYRICLLPLVTLLGINRWDLIKIVCTTLDKLNFLSYFICAYDIDLFVHCHTQKTISLKRVFDLLSPGLSQNLSKLNLDVYILKFSGTFAEFRTDYERQFEKEMADRELRLHKLTEPYEKMGVIKRTKCKTQYQRFFPK